MHSTDQPNSLIRRESLRIVWGSSALGELEAELRRLQVERALLVCGRSLAQDAVLQDAIASASGGHLVGVFAGVRAQSPLTSVMAGADAFHDLSADAIVAVGGGSAMVTARAIAIATSEKQPLVDLATSRRSDGSFHSPRLNAPKPPIVVMPTTPTTAIAAAGSAVTVPGEHDRLAMFDPKTRASSVIIDGLLVQSAPIELVRSAAFNALSMSVEGLLSARANPFSDAYLSAAFRGLIAALDPETPDRLSLVLHALMTGDAAAQTGAGMAAALAHAIGHLHHVPNGSAAVAVLPHVVAWLRAGHPTVADRVTSKLDALGTNLELALASVNAPTHLAAFGVVESDLEALTDTVMNDFATSSSPREVNPAGVTSVLAAAL